jgi:hypothetical protein
MPDPSTIFAWTVTVLAGLAVLAVLAFIIVWAVLGIRRELARDRRPPASHGRPSRLDGDPSSRYWPEHAHLNVV